MSENLKLAQEIETLTFLLRKVCMAGNNLTQTLARHNLSRTNAVALGNALAYGQEVTALLDVIEAALKHLDESTKGLDASLLSPFRA